MVHDYAEDLLKSMKIVAEYCFNDQHFDETLICTIVDNQDAKNGHYIVSDGTIKFDAYSDVMDYKINDAVRVTILKGDYTQKKYITGKSVSENMSQPLTYVAPSDTVLDMTNNIFDRKGSWGTMANGGKEKQLQCIWSANLNDEQFKHIQTSSIYDAIILKADFKTLLGQYNLVKGSFGLRLDMYISTSSDHSTGILKRGYLDSSDMFGDFYNFVVYTNQEAKFNINQDEIIHTMSLYLYENEDFYNQDDSGNYQKIDPLAELLKIDNILVSNIYIGLGTNLINVEDNRLVITTEDDLNYNLDNSLVHNYKNIKLVWYNKDDNNKYIGFSDGRVSRDEDTIIDYDEKKYLEKANEHQLCVKQLGKEDVPNDLDGLKLSSYLEKIKSPLSQLTQLIDRDLTQEIKRFRSRLQGIHNESNNEEIQIFGQALSNIEDALTAFEKAKEDILITNLENSLKCAAAVQRGKGAWSDGKYVEDEITYEPGTVKSLSDAIASVNKALSDIHTTVMQNLLPQTRSLILSNDPAYIGSYNNYSDRLSAILKQLEQQESTLTSIVKGSTDDSEELTGSEIYSILDDLIKKINGDAKFKQYNIVEEENKLKDDDNKYSIYWYYYNPIGGNDPNDPFVDENWRLLKPQGKNIEVLDLTDSVTLQNENSNIGLPEVIDSKDEYYPATGSGDHSVAKIILLPNNSIEKIKAVLVYNHEAFTSNEITFTNANPSVDIELIDNIVIEHGNYSMPTYAKYGVDNTLISLSDQSRCRELILNYYTEHGALDNSQLQDATIYWYMPAASTMLKVAKNLNISSEDEEGFIPEIATAAFNVIGSGNTITRLERTEIRAINDNKYIYQGVVYTIDGETPSGKIVEEKDGTVAIKEIIDVQGSEFEFQGKIYSINGRNVVDNSSGKKYTIKNNIVNLPLLSNTAESEYHRDGFICYQKRITDFVNDNKFYYQIEDYYSSAFTNNTIYCKIVKGNAKLEASIELNFSTFGSNGTDYSLIIKPFNSSGALIPTMSKNEEVQQYSYDFEVNLYDYDNNLVDLVEEQHNVSVEIIGSQESQGSGSYNDGAYQNIITTYRAIGYQPISYRVLKVGVNVKIDPSKEEGDKTVLLSAYRPIPYAASDNLRYQGPTTIIYDSSGANPSYYKGLLKLFEFDESSGDLKELNDVIWGIKYYDDEGTEIEELTGILSSYMPTIKPDKTLAPSVMYLTNANCNPVLLAKRNNIVWWAQPIYISQNRYASPMLNNWDNKLTIDEKNGTILSNFVGAGIKTENNSFSGVLMGKIEAATGIEIDGADDDLLTWSLATNHTGIGLYGFNEGTQSFGFNINGTAFLGKSGGGRISFDGNHGFIYSQNWLNSFKQYSDTKEGNYNIEEEMEVDGKTVIKYWNGRYDNPFVIDKTGNVSLSSRSKDGMAIDLQNGHIDAYNFKLTSKGIQLNSNPGNGESYITIGSTSENAYLNFTVSGELALQASKLIVKAGTDPDQPSLIIDSTVPEIVVKTRPVSTKQMRSNASNQSTLLHISPDSVVMQSAGWGTEEITYPQYKWTGTEINVRSGPGTKCSALDKKATGAIITVYDTATDGNGYHWFRINKTTESEAQWVAGLDYPDTGSMWRVYSSGSAPKAGGVNRTGNQFDSTGGKLIMHKDHSKSLIIDLNQNDYPFQLGSYVNNSNYRNFRIGWDGSIHGGLAYKWFIDTAGVAQFDYLTANSGGTIGGWTIGADQLSVGSEKSYVTLCKPESDGYVMWAGAKAATDAPFKLTATGKLTTSDIIVTDGSIKIGEDFEVSKANVRIKGALEVTEEGSFGSWKVKKATVGYDNLRSSDWLGSQGYLVIINAYGICAQQQSGTGGYRYMSWISLLTSANAYTSETVPYEFEE